MQSLFQEHQQIYTWLTIDLVKRGLKKRKQHEANKEAISDLTNPTFDAAQVRIVMSRLHLHL